MLADVGQQLIANVSIQELTVALANIRYSAYCSTGN